MQAGYSFSNQSYATFRGFGAANSSYLRKRLLLLSSASTNFFGKTKVQVEEVLERHWIKCAYPNNRVAIVWKGFADWTKLQQWSPIIPKLVPYELLGRNKFFKSGLWRWLLKLRQETRKFLSFEVKYGTRIFLWHYMRHPDGILFQRYRQRVIYDAANRFKEKFEYVLKMMQWI